MKARWFTLLTVVLCCSACGAPSLRHKKEVNKLLAAGDYAAAEQKLDAAQCKQYAKRDALLYYLDSAVILHDADQPRASDRRLALAQDRIDELFTQSVSAHAGRYLVNDLTVPYYPAPFERALTYYYRAMNFLSVNDIGGALVEANKAVFYLDRLSSGVNKDRINEPFMQYFMSLVFESAGKRDDARIARARALEGYAALNGQGGLPGRVSFEAPAADRGEVVLVHANGLVPLKKSVTFQVGWNEIFWWARSASEGERPSPEIQNAVAAGLLGNLVTVSYPVLEEQPFEIKTSEALTRDGRVYPTLLMGNVSLAVQTDLKNRENSVLLRSALRAAAKRLAAVQAGRAAASAAEDDATGELTEMVLGFLGALTEKADTRQWFTLPAQLRMTRFYVRPGVQDIILRFRDGFGNIVGEYTFKDVPVYAGGRVYLHYRTAK